MTGSQMLCESLIREGVEVMFGIPGGAILPFYGALPQYPQLRHILTRHEQGAAHAADGYARATGKCGVCVATSGPGVTNLVTGIACAQMDSSPVVAITGQVPRAMIGRDAFQEADATGITLPITKHNTLVMRTEDIPRVVREAFYIANTGRPGPVLVDIPRDVLQEEGSFHWPEEVDLRGYKVTTKGHPAQIKRAAQLIKESQRPVIIAGHGVIISRAYEELKEFAEKAQIPVINTLLGTSCFPQTHVLSLGMPGMHGVAWASISIDEADLVIGIGMRFDDRVTGRIKDFAPKAKVIHIDVDPAEMGKNVSTLVPIVGDVKAVLKELNKAIEPTTRLEWLQQIEIWKKEHPSLEIRETNQLLPQFILRKLWEITHGEAILVTGVGQHQMWAAQHYFFHKPNTFITSGGLGAMGFEVPAAMGAKVGRPNETVWSIAGDGGFQMTMSELATMAENNIAVKIGIMNNNCLGMVRQWQEFFYKKQYTASVYSGNPDFVKLAEAFGILGLRATRKEEVEPVIRKAMEHPGPVVVDFVVEPEENVYPMIPAGTSVKEMIEEPKGVMVG